VICGLAAVGFSRLLYWTEDQFAKLPIDELWWPAIGALGLGVIGYFVPRVLGVGYDTISDILNANLALKVLVVVMLAKAVALVVSLGSGTSGGLLAPMFMSSAALGGVFGMGMNEIFLAAHLSAGAFALVAMGAVFGAASRAAFSFIVFAFRITRDYNSVLPLMLVAVIAEGVAISAHADAHHDRLIRRGCGSTRTTKPTYCSSGGIGNHGSSSRYCRDPIRGSGHLPSRAGSQRHQACCFWMGRQVGGIITRADILPRPPG
jgi:H+/Cl- antiporter ClcA